MMEAQRIITDMLQELKAAAMRHDMRQLDAISVRLEVFTRAYTMPEIDNTGILLRLTSKECRLLDVIKTRGGKVISRECLMDALYFDKPYCDWPEEKIIDVFICKVNRKLKGTGHKLENVWGMGYRYTFTQPEAVQ